LSMDVVLDPKFALAGDFNGDGISDILICFYRKSWRANNHVYFRTLFGTNSSNFRNLFQTNPEQSVVMERAEKSNYKIGDFNGDGRLDLAHLNKIESHFKIYISKSDSF